MNPSSVPSQREINESLRNQLQALQKDYKREQQPRFELQEQLKFNDSSQRDEIARMTNYLGFLGWFSDCFLSFIKLFCLYSISV